MSRRERSLYDLFSLPSTASHDELHTAWKRLVAQYHPDRHDDHPLRQLAEEKVAELNAAWAVLSDPVKRARYDAQLAGVGPPPSQAGAWLLKYLLRAAMGFVVFLVLVRVGPHLVRLLMRVFLSGTPIGGVVFLVGLVGGAWWWRRRKRRK